MEGKGTRSGPREELTTYLQRHQDLTGEDPSSAVIERVGDYLLSCFRSESPPRVSELARVLNMHRNNLEQIFQAVLNVTPSYYLKRNQIETARILLLTTTLAVGKIAYLTAFGTRRTFLRTFKRIIGQPPGQYRARMQNVSRQASTEKQIRAVKGGNES